MTLNNQKFHFRIQIKDLSSSDIPLEDRLYTAGCNDSLFHVDFDGIYLDFTREAPNQENAIKSAIQNIQSADCEVIQVSQTS